MLQLIEHRYHISMTVEAKHHNRQGIQSLGVKVEERYIGPGVGPSCYSLQTERQVPTSQAAIAPIRQSQIGCPKQSIA